MEDEENQEVRFVITKPKSSRRRHPVRFIVILLLVFGAIGYCGWRYRQIVVAPIDVRTATDAQAVSWFALRDLSAESEETRGELFDFYFQKVAKGEHGEFVFDEEHKLEVPSNLQGIASSVLRSSERKVEAWDKKRTRAPFVRIDYVLKRPEGRSATYVTSSDILPGPGLEKRWQERQVAVAKGTVRRTNVERNIQLMLMQWFVKRYKAYDETPGDQKKEYLERCSRELFAIQECYKNLYVSSGRSAPDRVRQLREFERMNEGWCEFASLEELARVMWFKDLVITVTVLHEAGVADSPLYPPRYPEKTDDGGDSPCPAKPLLDAAKNYFFIEQ